MEGIKMRDYLFFALYILLAGYTLRLFFRIEKTKSRVRRFERKEYDRCLTDDGIYRPRSYYQGVRASKSILEEL